MVDLVNDPFPDLAALDGLWRSAWGGPVAAGYGRVLERSLVHVGAYEAGVLVGFVNVAWDGGVHAFVLDTCVHAEHQRKGIATALVQRAAELARVRGAEWLHVDFESQLEGFYRRCGFAPSAAGVMRLV
ncbi:GNAT family N-acetyltransferase [Devosia sp. ZW T5_3]|uniref:GNAT family N-acetyltransferase n=1 Tax=Devosia sp. ZW T5_3 TaxID=3378085 RepID=UPI003851C678